MRELEFRRVSFVCVKTCSTRHAALVRPNANRDFHIKIGTASYLRQIWNILEEQMIVSGEWHDIIKPTKGFSD